MSETMKPAYYVGTNSHSYRQGEPALILEVVTFDRQDKSSTVCFRVKYGDGKEDFCPISDYDNYKVLCFDDVRQAYHSDKT